MYDKAHRVRITTVPIDGALQLSKACHVPLLRDSIPRFLCGLPVAAALFCCCLTSGASCRTVPYATRVAVPYLLHIPVIGCTPVLYCAPHAPSGPAARVCGLVGEGD